LTVTQIKKEVLRDLANAGEDVRDPDRTLPLAFYGSVLIKKA
jgi:amino acid transporter